MPGAVTATVGLIAPSVIVILIVAAFLQAFRDSKYVAGAFYGLRPASTALITAAGLVVVRETFWLTGGVLFWQGTVLAAVLLVLTRWVEADEELAPHRVHRTLRPRGRGVPLCGRVNAKEKAAGRLLFLLCALLSPRSRCGWRCAA